MNLRGLRVKCGLVMLLWLMAAPCSAQVQAQAQVQVQVQAQAQAASAAQGALEAREQALREQLATLADGPQRYRLINDLADAYFRAGRVAEALRLGDAIVQDERIAAGRRSLRASALALSSALAGDFARSERYISRAKALARETRPQELEELPDEPAYAFLSAEAEIARRAHNRHDVALAKSREKSELAWANFNEPNGSDKRHAAAANALLNNVNLHVRLLVQNNRREEALSYAREMRERIARRADLKAGLAQTASVGEAWAIALTAQDDYNAALAAIGEAIATFVRAKVAEHDVGYSIALRTRLMIALALGRIGEFAPDADAMLRGRAVNPVLAGTLVIEEVDTLALASRGSWATAAERIGQAMERTARAQG